MAEAAFSLIENRIGHATRRPVALVVDDDANVRQLAAVLLEETGFKVLEARSAEEALHAVRSDANRIAFAFIELELPCLTDGVDLACRLAAHWPEIRVLVTSAQPCKRLEDLPPAARYMPKPWRALDVLVEAERSRQARSPAGW